MKEPLPEPRRAWLEPLSALLVSGALAVLVTWPLAADLSSSTWVGRFDVWITMWLLDWLAQGLPGGGGGSHEVFYPHGKSSLVFGHVAFQALGAPLVPWLGLTAAYNLLLLGALTASTWCAWLLTREVTGDHCASLLAGALFGTSPILLLEAGVGSLEHACAAPLPLALYFLARLRRTGRLGDALRLGLSTIAAALVSWYFGFFLALAGGLQVGLGLLGERPAHPRLLRGAALAVTVCLLGIAPIGHHVYHGLYSTGSGRGPLDFGLLSRDNQERLTRFVEGHLPLAWLESSELHTLASQEVFYNSYSLSEQISTSQASEPIQARLPWISLALGLGGALLAGRGGLSWSLLGLTSWILALGPALRFGGDFLDSRILEVPLPYFHLYNSHELMRQLFRSYRFLLLTQLALSVLAGYALAWLPGRLPGRWPGARPLAVVASLAGLVLIRWTSPQWPEIRLERTEVPSFYTNMAQTQGEGALLELPFYPIPPTPAQTRYIYYQTVHGWPLFNDHFVRTDELLQLREWVLKDSFLNALLELNTHSGSWPPRIRREDADRWFEQSFLRANLHFTFPYDPGSEERQMALEGLWALLSSLFGPPIQGPDGIRSFSLSPIPDSWSVDARGYLTGWPARPYTMILEALLPHAADPASSAHPEKVNYEVAAGADPIRGISFWARGDGPPGQPLRASLEGVSQRQDWEIPLTSGSWNWIHLREHGALLIPGGESRLLRVTVPGEAAELRRVTTWTR